MRTTLVSREILDAHGMFMTSGFVIRQTFERDGKNTWGFLASGMNSKSRGTPWKTREEAQGVLSSLNLILPFPCPSPSHNDNSAFLAKAEANAKKAPYHKNKP